MTDKSTAREGFNKQRRNLLLVSIFIIFLTQMEVEVTHLSFAGNAIAVKDPDDLYRILVVLLIYWWWRCVTFLNELNPVGFVTEIKRQFNVLMDKEAEKSLMAYLEQEYPERYEADIKNYFSNASYTVSRSIPAAERVYHFSSVFFEYPSIENSSSHIDSWHVDFEKNCSRIEGVRFSIQATISVIFSRSFFTEYALPHILAFLAAISLVLFFLNQPLPQEQSSLPESHCLAQQTC